MHFSVMNFVGECVEKYNLSTAKVLEVGSCNVNGSVRPFFHGNSYTGLDSRPGKGVDDIGLACALPYSVSSFDVVICTEMLEHDLTPWLSVAEMSRVPGRAGISSSPAGAMTSGACSLCTTRPNDVYRFSVLGIEELFRWAGIDPDLGVARSRGSWCPGRWGQTN